MPDLVGVAPVELAKDTHSSSGFSRHDLGLTESESDQHRGVERHVMQQNQCDNGTALTFSGRPALLVASVDFQAFPQIVGGSTQHDCDMKCCQRPTVWPVACGP